MAINPQKLIPTSGLSPAERMAASYDKKVDDVLNMKAKLINVDKFLKNSYTTKKKEQEKKKKEKQSEERSKREKKLELPKGIKGIGKIKSLIPATGILGAVEKFATFTFIGYLFTKFESDLPKLLEVTSKIAPVADGIEKIIGGIFESTVGFIDAGYKAYDQMRALSKDIGGEKAQKTYDEFSKNFNYVTNAILTLGLSTLVQPKPTKSNGGLVTGYAQGGPVTRGGKVVGGVIGRTLKVQSQRLKQQQKLRPQPTQPGKDVGGKKQIEKLYPNPKITNIKTPNPYKALTDASKTLKQGGSTGILMAAGIDLALGQNLDFNLMSSLSGDFLFKSKVNEVLQSIRNELHKGDKFESDVPIGSPGAGGGGGGGVEAPTMPNDKVISDAKEFRKAFPLPKGTPQVSADPNVLQMRENTMLYKAGIGNDKTIERVHAQGSDHYSNHAIDIPVNDRKTANEVMKWWRSKGYGVLDEFDSGGHIHVYWAGKPKSKKSDRKLQSMKGAASGVASFYGGPTDTYWQGRKTSSGQVFDENAFSVALKDSLPFGMYQVSYGGKTILVRGNDRGGFESLGRDLDLSYGAAKALGITGTGKVTYKRVGDLQESGGGVLNPEKPKPKPKPTIKPKAKTNWWDNLNPFKPKPKPKPSVEPGTAAMQDGGFVGPQSRRNYSSLSMYPSYDGGGMSIAIQPIIIEKPVSVSTGGNKAIMFPVPVSVNTNMASLSRS